MIHLRQLTPRHLQTQKQNHVHPILVHRNRRARGKKGQYDVAGLANHGDTLPRRQPPGAA